MAKWTVYVMARKIGAQGIRYNHTIEVEAETKEGAIEVGLEKAYETLEHVSISDVVEVKENVG